MSRSPRVGLLWRYEWDPPDADPPKLDGVFSALAELGADAEAVVYSDDAVEQVRAQLLGLDGVLIWVNPIQGGLDRSRLDPLLREVSEAGVFVSAHPDVILRMGTKRVLVDTRSLGWGTETRIYHDWDEFRRELPRRLEDGATLVLKQHRGMGGIGIWKVELADTDSVVVQQAAEGQGTDAMALAEFLDSCAPYFRGGAPMVEQPYQPRLPDGLIRAYLTHDRVVGFTHQYPHGLLPPTLEPRQSAKLFEPSDEPRYRALRHRLEDEWVPEMQRLLALRTDELPVIWDADFLYGPEDENGEDTFVLCEINCSSTFAFPEFAMPAVARATLERIRAAYLAA